MNPHEHALDYPFGDTLPAPAARLEVAPGVHWLRMPLPFQLDHINLWLLHDDFGGEGWTLVDTGIASDEIRTLWERLFETGLDGLPIRRILCTHTHPDHVGNAAWLQQRHDAPVWMTLGEYALGRVLSSCLPGADGESAYGHFRRHGVPDGPGLEAIRVRNRRYFATLVPEMPLSFRRIRADEPVTIGGRRWQVIIGTGHSPEHASLYCEADGLLISGDMVLPRISTNVSVFDIEPESNPVRWYLDSLGEYARCREDTLVLPSHGRPFRGMHRRIAQLLAHHEDRLALVRQLCTQGSMTAAELVPKMFNREFDTHQLTFALGEALAHLHALWYTGELRRDTGADGVVRFARA